MDSVTDIPLYDIIQEIEGKWGESTHMVIDAFIDDDEETPEGEYAKDNKDLPENLLFWCEFQDQVKVFDNLASAKHWFLEEVEYDPDHTEVVVDYTEETEEE